MDLADLWRGGLTPRRAAVLAWNLPPGARTWVAADVSPAWTTEGHLLAGVVDRLNVANWQRSEDGSKGRNQPDPVPRPGDGTSQKAETAVEKALAFRARQQEKTTNEPAETLP